VSERIFPAGQSWLYEQCLRNAGIDTNSNYIDADLMAIKDTWSGETLDAGPVWVIATDNSVLQIDKRCIDKMPPMPDTFHRKKRW